MPATDRQQNFSDHLQEYKTEEPRNISPATCKTFFSVQITVFFSLDLFIWVLVIEHSHRIFSGPFTANTYWELIFGRMPCQLASAFWGRMNVYYSKKTFGPIVYFADPLSCRIGLSFLIKWKLVASCKPPEDLGLFSTTFFFFFFF